MLNPQFGVISPASATCSASLPWFSDPYWAKAGILLIQLWLGFPYMFVVITGALQTLPPDIYEAADLDGAGPWAKFRRITLPLLLITVGPLLVASFAFNFNNFTVIDLYSQGGPPIPNVPTPVGHTDILATYTYRIAFGSTGVSDYGYASAITVMIFIMLIIITMFQFRFTTMLGGKGAKMSEPKLSARFTTSVGSIRRRKRVTLIYRLALAAAALHLRPLPGAVGLLGVDQPDQLAGGPAVDPGQPDLGQLPQAVQRPGQPVPAGISTRSSWLCWSRSWGR